MADAIFGDVGMSLLFQAYHYMVTLDCLIRGKCNIW